MNATKMLGANFATETEKMEVGGSMRYNYRDADVVTVGSSQRFLQSGDSYSNSNKADRNKVTDFNADFRMEWRPDSMTNIIFRPNVSYNKTKGTSATESGTFNEDPYQYVVNPNDYLNFNNIGTDDPLRDTRINACLLYTSFHGKSSDTIRPAYNVIFRSIISQISQGSTYMYLDTLIPVDIIGKSHGSHRLVLCSLVALIRVSLNGSSVPILLKFR